MHFTRRLLLGALLAFAMVNGSGVAMAAAFHQLTMKRGIVALIDLPAGGVNAVHDLLAKTDLILYFQSNDPRQIMALRASADDKGVLGNRIFVAFEETSTVHLADNIADALYVSETASQRISDDELLRVVHPNASIHDRERVLRKPVPLGVDNWSHPYHGPDNNPNSTDQLVKGDLRTQFLGFPKFSPMPEQTVVAGGRMYKAMGHIAHKANQNESLNTLLCINAYNGTILWRRSLPEGFMIHRNTMVATEDALYLGDNESCKVIDGETGELRDEYVIKLEQADGPVWKWMAIRNGVLFGLVGNQEVKVDTKKSARRGLGHWPWGMWDGHDYENLKTAFGFGRTLVAIDLDTGKVRWNKSHAEFIDARSVCMSGQQIFYYCPTRFLGAVSAETGDTLWQNKDQNLLDAIGVNGRAQHYITGYATSCYVKCNDRYLFFAGPQRERMAVASTDDGSLKWTYPVGNLQLVLRDDGVWAAGPEKTNSGFRFDYDTGEVLAKFPARRACTRATGCVDSIFYRASGGTVRVFTEENRAQHIDPMRPPCQDGVLVSNGMLYWGPWMCGCQLSLYGNIGLAAARDQGASQTTGSLYADALVTSADVKALTEQVEPLASQRYDWPTWQADNARSNRTSVGLPKSVETKFQAKCSSGHLPTAPVIAGGFVFVADRSGTVRAFDLRGNEVWKAYVAGAVYFPPTIDRDRLYLGSADGRIYAFEAKTGRQLWSFRVAPADDWIAVYGKLISRWPVSGGVVVQDGLVYAAAGIAHYDGTYLVAVDAVTGRLKAANISSGSVQQEVNNGISLQGELTVVDGELRFLAGGVYETARYDLRTLECLNTPQKQVHSQFRTAFYPYYPSYGKFVSLDVACRDGCSLTHDASYEGSQFSNLMLEEPLPPGVDKPRKEAARWIKRRGGQPPKMIWRDTANRRFTSFVVSDQQLLATGHTEANPEKPFLVSIDLQDGSDSWLMPLPADAVKGGTAIDQNGRIFVATEDGTLICFSPKS